MWKWMPIIWVLTGATGIYGVVTGISYMKEREAIRCQAAQQTILDEAELIAAGGKFPGEKITDRWKALLEGCS